MIFMPFACTETLFHITDWRESEISLGKIVIFHFKLAEHSSNEAPDWLMRHLIEIFQMWLVFFNLSVSVDVVWRKWHFGQLIITHQTLKQTLNKQQRSSKKNKKYLLSPPSQQQSWQGGLLSLGRLVRRADKRNLNINFSEVNMTGKKH